MKTIEKRSKWQNSAKVESLHGTISIKEKLTDFDCTTQKKLKRMIFAICQRQSQKNLIAFFISQKEPLQEGIMIKERCCICKRERRGTAFKFTGKRQVTNDVTLSCENDTSMRRDLECDVISDLMQAVDVLE
jgi:hypothetical protein